jgi:sugar phosphate isomerase/epimerase
MQIGLGSYACAWSIGVPGYEVLNPMDVFAFVQLAHELGFSLVQIADNLPLQALTEAEQMRLLEQLKTLNLTVEVGTRGIQKEHLKTYLEIAKTFDSRILRVVVDGKNHHPTPDEVIRLVADVLEDFERADIILAIENHDRFSAKTLADIIKTLSSKHVGICLDTVNSFGSLEGSEVVIDTLAPYTVNLHIKDFDIRRKKHNMGFTIFGTPAGQGRLNIPQLISQLGSYGKCKTGVLELWPSPEASIEATVLKEQDWLRQSADYLRGYNQV